jgi:hypothetical protein
MIQTNKELESSSSLEEVKAFASHFLPFPYDALQFGEVASILSSNSIFVKVSKKIYWMNFTSLQTMSKEGYTYLDIVWREVKFIQ